MVVNKQVVVVASKIKKLEIQGARNIAEQGLKTLSRAVSSSKAKDLRSLKKEFKQSAKLLQEQGLQNQL